MIFYDKSIERAAYDLKFRMLYFVNCDGDFIAACIEGYGSRGRNVRFENDMTSFDLKSAIDRFSSQILISLGLNFYGGPRKR